MSDIASKIAQMDVVEHEWSSFTEEEKDYAVQKLSGMLQGLIYMQGVQHIRDKINRVESASGGVLLSTDEIDIIYHLTSIGNDFLAFVGEFRNEKENRDSG